MSGNKNLMSENLKEEIAKELGVYETVKKEWKLEQCISTKMRFNGCEGNRNRKQKSLGKQGIQGDSHMRIALCSKKREKYIKSIDFTYG